MLIIAITLCCNSFAQTTIILQPNDGKDAPLLLINGTYHPEIDWENTNFGDSDNMRAGAWTWDGYSGYMRFLLEFDLSEIPSDATISSAKLSLYFTGTEQIQSCLSGSNEVIVQRVTSSWDEGSVTWNNQPSVSGENALYIPRIDNPTDDLIDFDLTPLIVDVFQNYPNYGFLFQAVDESPYRRMTFATSDNSDASLHPKLEITYTSETDPDNGDTSGTDETDPCVETIYQTIYETRYETKVVYDTIWTTSEVYDTVYVNEVVPVYDTVRVENLVNVYDTVQIEKPVTVYDTINVENLVEIFDTIAIEKIVEIYDTTYIEQFVEVFDTIPQYVSVTDTLIIDVWITGVYAYKVAASVKVYPNPTYKDLNISIDDLSLLENYKIDIVNTKGQSIFLTNIYDSKFTVSFDDFRDRGLYFVRILDPNYQVIETKKILLK